MRARLAFALVAHLNPDVLIVDEALAVGDITFQKKAADYIHRYLSEGGALIFVSHNPFQIQTVCNRGLVLEKGEQVFAGSDLQALNFFYELETQLTLPDSAPAATVGPVTIRDIAVRPVDSEDLWGGASAQILLRYHAKERTRVLWGFSIWTQDQSVCVAGERSSEAVDLEPGDGELICLVPRLPLVAGGYMVTGAIVDPDTKVPFDMQLGRGRASPLRIRGSERDVNHRATGQIIALEVEWQNRFRDG
jgi:lipopolysaccharide transport system ATP-binding protein